MIFILDSVLVPWENAFLYGDLDKANRFFPRTGSFPRLLLHGCTRLAVKPDFIAGLLLKAVEVAGTNRFRGVEVNGGEVLVWRNLFWAISEAMARNPQTWVNGYVLPDAEAGAAYQALAYELRGQRRGGNPGSRSTALWPRARRTGSSSSLSVHGRVRS